MIPNLDRMSFIADLRDPTRDHATVAAHLCDWLTDGSGPAGVTLADVLEAYAAEPWIGDCKTCEGSGELCDSPVGQVDECPDCDRGRVVVMPSSEDDSLSPLVVEWLRREGDARAERWEAWHVRQSAARTRTWLVADASGAEVCRSESHAWRELKRRRLKLFPEVRIRRTVTGREVVYLPRDASPTEIHPVTAWGPYDVGGGTLDIDGVDYDLDALAPCEFSCDAERMVTLVYHVTPESLIPPEPNLAGYPMRFVDDITHTPGAANTFELSLDDILNDRTGWTTRPRR